MIEIIKIAVLSILFWQTVSCIAVIINESKGTYFAICVPAFILECFSWVYRKISLKYVQKHYCRVSVRSEKYVNELGPNIFTFYCTHKQYEKFYHKGENGYYIEFLKDGSTFKSTPFKNEYYRGQESFGGYKDFKKKFINPNK